MAEATEDGRVDTEALAAVVAYLRQQRGVDFSVYKSTTLARRIRQAMAKTGAHDLDTYLDHLQADPAVLNALLDSLLIKVTGFFRDPDVWAELRDTVLPRLVDERPQRPLRIWSAGCATGEEPYTLAMVLADLLGVERLRNRVKIYATDVDHGALATARTAEYSGRALEDLPPDIRERYLERVGDDRFTVRKEVRRSVVFGRNDLVQDAPISRIDLLLCRNTLMYYTADTQARILERLHFATAPDGVLVLGKAETALTHLGLFAPIDSRRRIFAREELAAGQGRRRLDVGGDDGESGSELDRLHAEALGQGPLAQIVVSRTGRITLVNRRARELLPASERDLGRLIQDADVSFRPIDLRSLLLQVRTEQRQAAVRGALWHTPTGEDVVLDVEAYPLADASGEPLGTVVSFHDVSTEHSLRAEVTTVRNRLHGAYEELQSTTEELETTNEELQSTVEELETTNEELQSTNEELETMNEELRTVNEELHARGVEEMARTNRADDLNAVLDTVMEAIGTAVVVVDRNLVVTVWTSSAEELWGVRRDEAIGRPLDALDIALDPAIMVTEARTLLADDAYDGDGTGSHRLGGWVDSINRRGRPIRLRLSARAVRAGDTTTRAILIAETAPSGRNDVRAGLHDSLAQGQD